MNSADLILLDAILGQANKQRQTLRVRFEDGEEYDLYDFLIAQDHNEDYPHCTSAIVQIINAPAEKHESLKPGNYMFLHLNEIVVVKNISNGTLLFQRNNV